MAQEVERKFLVSDTPSFLNKIPYQPIRQGYIASEDGGNEVRVREKGENHWLTVKSSGELTRIEVEIPISKAHFDQLWTLTEHRRIEKHRHLINDEGRIIEIDVFQGSLEGLVLAEIEFDSIEKADSYAPPSWMGKEVTYDANFKNRNLALKG
ncbi:MULTISPECIES: CYTH domain-containing protein [unclassified Saccharicrinis]|uniref:CYTH domain-containing protein n=1 Tax=unclassified Saccharicrinis TaxID=2646859 RepID=UPI003D356FF4